VGVTGATCTSWTWLDMTAPALDACGSDGSDLHHLFEMLWQFL